MLRDLRALPKIRDSSSYLYVEHCRIDRQDAAIAFESSDGRTDVPIAGLCILLLGPGTTITHAAMRTLAENGCSVTWAGEHGVRCYAGMTGETHSAQRLLQQAALLCDPQLRREVVWRMYEQRFGYRLDQDLSLAQIRGMEGARMREIYATAAVRYGVDWRGRRFVPGDWAATDPPNRALSAANACLYGLCHAAVVSVGYSPGLGFIHTGHQLSFVFDVADLFKSEIAIPTAFRIVGQDPGADLGARVRRACRDTFHSQRLLERIVPVMDHLMGLTKEDDTAEEPAIKLPSHLWETLVDEPAESESP